MTTVWRRKRRRPLGRSRWPAGAAAVARDAGHDRVIHLCEELRVGHSAPPSLRTSYHQGVHRLPHVLTIARGNRLFPPTQRLCSDLKRANLRGRLRSLPATIARHRERGGNHDHQARHTSGRVQAPIHSSEDRYIYGSKPDPEHGPPHWLCP